MKILHVNCSPRGRSAESFRLSEGIVGHLRGRHPGAAVVKRELTPDTIPHVDGDYAAVLGGWREAGEPAGGTLHDSDRLIAELEACDCLVIATPMHNFTVPSVLKAWIDHVVRVHRTFSVSRNGKVGNLRDRPVFIAVSSGGHYAGDAARQPDFLTPYLTAILNTIGLFDITFFAVGGTAQGSDALMRARQDARAGLDRHFAERYASSRSSFAVGAC